MVTGADIRKLWRIIAVLISIVTVGVLSLFHCWTLAYFASMLALPGAAYDVFTVQNRSWRKVLLVAYAGLFIVANLAFAGFFLREGIYDGGDRITDYWDAFYFSIGIWTGYGDLSPSPTARLWVAGLTLYGYAYLALFIAQVTQLLLDAAKNFQDTATAKASPPPDLATAAADAPTDEIGSAPANDGGAVERYKSAASLVSEQGRMIWLIFSAFLVSQGILMAAILREIAEGAVPSFSPSAFAASIVGFLLCILWFVALSRSTQFYTFRVAQAVACEPKNWNLLTGPGKQYADGRLVMLGGTPFKFKWPGRWRTTSTMWIYAAIFAVGYGTAAVVTAPHWPMRTAPTKPGMIQSCCVQIPADAGADTPR